MLPLLSIKDLSLDFVSEAGTTNALKNISFELKRGEILAIVGESGSGKTVSALSVLRLLERNAKYSSGQIHFSEDGKNAIDLLKLNFEGLLKVRGEKIAMIFQEPMTSLNPVYTCGNQVAEVLQLHKNLNYGQAKKETIEWFRKVKLPAPEAMFERYPHQLSGGQKQRVMIAMAMCCKPSILICDEPTTALDVTVQKTILNLVKEIQAEESIGVLFITHDLGVVKEIADRAIIMYKGEIVEEGNVQTIFSQPSHPYTKGLLACRPLLHKKGERLPMVSDFLEGKKTTTIKETVHTPNKESRDLIDVQNLSVWFPAKRTFFGKPKSFIHAVDDVSFTVKKGETLGLVGESGSGKTTLGRALLRLVEPERGKIMYNGVDITALSQHDLKPLRKKVQLIFQDPYSSLNPRITVEDALKEPMQVHGTISSVKQRREKAVELLEKVNLEARHLKRYPHEFSGGQRQRIVIARALALNPDFMVCDESVSALDVSVQAQVLNLLNDIKKEFGLTMIFISHDLAVVRYISDRMIVMHNGKIVESGPSEEIYQNPKEEYTKRLIEAIPKG